MKSFYQAIALFGFLSLFTISICHAEEMQPNTQMSPEQQEMMVKMKERTSPSAAHQLLESLNGNWSYTAKFSMGPQDAAEETTGASNHEIIYGGRFLKQTVIGTAMGQPFEGTGILGYDNIKGEYISVWFDSMATGIMTESGSYDEASKTIKFAGKNSCPVTGDKERACRSELIFVDATHYTYSAYTNGPDGQEYKAMEINYTKA